MSKKKELFCYLRVSTQTQVETGSSIENQRFLGQKVCKQLGMNYVEMNESGSSTMIRSEEDLLKSPRPKLEELKEGMRIGRVKHIWYYSRSRWCRDEIEDGLIRRHYLQKYKVKVYEGVNGELRKYGTSQERYMDSQFSLIQEFFKDTNREVSVSGKRHKSRSEGDNSCFMGGTMNFGYKNVDKRFVINREESKWIKRLYSLYLQGTSLKDIKVIFDTSGVKTRRGGLWSLGTLLSMLKNRIYIGEFKWKDKETQEEFLIVVPKILSHSVFNRVQKKMKKNLKNKGNNSRLYESLLSDFLVCYCGENITGNIRQTVGKKIYVCSSKKNKWKGKVVNECENRRNMNMDSTDSFVVEEIKKVVGDSSKLKEDFKKGVLSKKKLEKEEIEEEKKILEKNIKLIDDQIEMCIRSISTNEFNLMMKKTDKRVHKEIKKSLDEELGQLEDRKKGWIQEIDDLDNRKEWVDWIGKYGEDNLKRFKTPTTELLEGFINEIVVTPTFDKNRDGKRVQVGHKLNVNFSQPIVNDKIEYVDDKNRSKGYNLVKGKKKSDIGTVVINKGGRGKKKDC